MTDEEKNRADILVELLKTRWGQFNARREYEFKVTLTFWSGLALAIVGFDSIEWAGKLPCSCLAKAGVVVVGLAIVSVHVFWAYGIMRSSHIDRNIAHSYEALLRQPPVGHDYPANVEKEIKRWSMTLDGAVAPESIGRLFWTRMRCTVNWCMRSWSHVFQVSVTALLACLLVFVMWPREAKTSDKEQQQLAWLKADTKRLVAEVEGKVSTSANPPSASTGLPVHGPTTQISNTPTGLTPLPPTAPSASPPIQVAPVPTDAQADSPSGNP